jgi:hypothetical protein
LKGQAAQQVFEHLGVDVVDRLLKAAANLLAKLVVGTGGVPTRPDERVVLGEPRRRSQPVEAGKELALGQVSGGTEENEDVWTRAFLAMLHRWVLPVTAPWLNV